MIRPFRCRPSHARHALVACVTAMATLLGASTTLAAATSPKLVKPANKGTVHGGHIQLVVRDSSSLAKKYGVFVSISRSRKTNAHGQLKEVKNVSKGGGFIEMKAWKGHPGMWIYKPPKYTFPGFWASTAGRYYWQAEHTDCEIKGCEALSKIQSFTEVD